jgi:calcineurin-like phosphoesterase family protein
MEDVFVKNINDAISTVDQSKRNKVMVINCGDFIFASGQNSYEHYLNFRNKLIPCTWYNVSGNHDNNNLYRTVKFIGNDSGFEELNIQNQSVVYPAWYWSSMYILEIYRGAQVICVVTISHYPQDDYLGCINIHGHLHTYEDLTYFKGSDKEWAISLRKGGHHQDVGVDRNYGKPMWLSDILEGKIDVDINKVPQLKSMRWQYKINFR